MVEKGKKAMITDCRAKQRKEAYHKIHEYEKKLYDEFITAGFKCDLRSYGIYIYCGIDHWLVDVRGQIKDNHAHIKLYHKNVISFYEGRKQCQPKKQSLFPDMHLQFSKKHCTVEILIKYIKQHQNKYN